MLIDSLNYIISGISNVILCILYPFGCKDTAFFEICKIAAENRKNPPCSLLVRYGFMTGS